MEKTTIEKLKAYLKSKKKFGDYGCFVITKEIEKAMGFEDKEMASPQFWERFVSAVQDVYPDTARECAHYSFGMQQEENVTDEDSFSAWLAVQKHLSKTKGEARIVALHHVPKFREKILLRGLLAGYRSHKLHVFVFEETFTDGVPFLVKKHCENGEHLQELVTTPEPTPEVEPEKLVQQDPSKAGESQAKAPEKEEPAMIKTEKSPEKPIQEEPELEEKSQAKTPEVPVAKEAPVQPKENQPVTNPIPNPPQPRGKRMATRNYIADAYTK